MTIIAQKQNSEVKLYEFTDEQSLRARLLSPETIAYYEHAATELLIELGNFTFSSDPKERDDLIKTYVSIKAQRDFLLGLLNDCQLAYATMASTNPSDNSGESNVISF